MVAHVVIDTDVCSFLLKGDSRVQIYRPHLIDNIACLSFQTVGELYQWAQLRSWGNARRAQLAEWLDNFIILESDRLTCRLWACIRAEREERGHPISPQDAWIAACAQRHGYPLVTHNGDDYQYIGDLQLITGR